jgi:hypothetical protein
MKGTLWVVRGDDALKRNFGAGLILPLSEDTALHPSLGGFVHKSWPERYITRRVGGLERKAGVVFATY